MDIGVLWIDKSGAPRRERPKRRRPWQTVDSRQYRAGRLPERGRGCWPQARGGQPGEGGAVTLGAAVRRQYSDPPPPACRRCPAHKVGARIRRSDRAG